MSAKQNLLDAWKTIYDTQLNKVLKDLEGEDSFNDEDGEIYYKLREEYSEEQIDEMKPKEKEEAWSEAVEGWIRDRWSDFESKFKHRAQEDKGMLMANRCIAVDDAEEFLFFVANESPLPEYDGLGIYWSWNKEDAECHWGGGSTGAVFVHALIPFESIDPYVMLIQNLRPSTGEDESEIYLKEGSKVFVTGVEMPEGNEVVEAPKPIQMTAATGPYRYRNIAKILLELTVGKN